MVCIGPLTPPLIYVETVEFWSAIAAYQCINRSISRWPCCRHLTILALAVYGIDRERALAYAIVLYAVAFLPKIALGLLIMTAGPHGFSFQAVRELARRGDG